VHPGATGFQGDRIVTGIRKVDGVQKLECLFVGLGDRAPVDAVDLPVPEQGGAAHVNEAGIVQSMIQRRQCAPLR